MSLNMVAPTVCGEGCASAASGEGVGVLAIAGLLGGTSRNAFIHKPLRRDEKGGVGVRPPGLFPVLPSSFDMVER
jgi:hypothetical protein